ncbi:hypothetical protein C8J56DRAFT_1020704 [Mycena floridula]|nr:hypothetical protein C8J56DRAFT_1020704 [Mycena floridula]
MQFPVELYAKIIDGAEIKEHRSLRLANKFLYNLVTPKAFRTIRVSGTVEGAQRFSQLRDSRLAQHVKIVEFHQDTTDWDEEPGKCICLFSNFHLKMRFADEETRAAVFAAFSSLEKFSALDCLTIRFSPHFIQDNSWDPDEPPSCQRQLQCGLIQALVYSSVPPSLISLNLINMMGHSDPAFQRLFNIMGRLNSLVLSSISEIDYELSYCDEPFLKFWGIDIPTGILKPSETLTSLSLRSDQWPGSFIFESQNPVFPNLTHVSFNTILFTEEGIEAFLLRHSTLTHVELEDCPLSLGENDAARARKWFQVYGTLEASLKQLRVFMQFRVDYNGIRVEGGSYVTFLAGHGYRHEEIPEIPSIIQLDMIPRQRFMAAVKARNKLEV